MNIQVDYSWSEECLIIEGRTSELDAPELLKLALNVANSSSEKNWNLKATLRMGEVFLNNQCQQVENPYIMSCDHYSQPNIKANEFIPSQKHYEKNNIEIIFYEETDSQYVKSIGITIKVKLSDNNKSTATFSVLWPYPSTSSAVSPRPAMASTT
jgi:hypothetical protein